MKIRELIFEKCAPVAGNTLYSCTVELGRITVLDRLTGYGNGTIRDIETGFKDLQGGWWCRPGNFDIRTFPELELEEAIRLIKEDAWHTTPES